MKLPKNQMISPKNFFMPRWRIKNTSGGNEHTIVDPLSNP